MEYPHFEDIVKFYQSRESSWLFDIHYLFSLRLHAIEQVLRERGQAMLDQLGPAVGNDGEKYITPETVVQKLRQALTDSQIERGQLIVDRIHREEEAKTLREAVIRQERIIARYQDAARKTAEAYNYNGK